MKGKIIILSAPSGTGKSSIIAKIIDDPELRLMFSVSATSRAPRGEEVDGKEYYFLSQTEFAHRVENGDFVEWEEVYPGTCYGTLESEVNRILGSNHNLIMDIDVKGGINVKSKYGPEAVAIFIMPPSVEALAQRLRGRGTDSVENIQRRLSKAEYEMSFAPEYDFVVVNDDLDEAADRVKDIILNAI